MATTTEIKAYWAKHRFADIEKYKIKVGMITSFMGALANEFEVVEIMRSGKIKLVVMPEDGMTREEYIKSHDFFEKPSIVEPCQIQSRVEYRADRLASAKRNLELCLKACET